MIGNHTGRTSFPRLGRIGGVGLLLAVLLCLVSPANAAGSADSFIVVDAGSGRVLNAMNPTPSFIRPP